MRLPHSWLRDVVQAGAPGWDVSPYELENTLIRIGHEVEEVIPVGPVTGPLIVGRVAAGAVDSDSQMPFFTAAVVWSEAFALTRLVTDIYQLYYIWHRASKGALEKNTTMVACLAI